MYQTEAGSRTGHARFEPTTLGAADDPDDVIVVDVKLMAADAGLTLVT